MRSELPSLVVWAAALLPLLAGTALAAPAGDPAAVLDLLAPRQGSCPTITVWNSYDYTTIYASTTTLTDGYSSLGRVTSTKTERETRTINTILTSYSPAVVTSPSESAALFTSLSSQTARTMSDA